MGVRLSRLPKGARGAELEPPPRRRRPPMRGVWRCCGVNGCGEIVEGTWASMERHLDAHGGGRAEQILEQRGDDDARTGGTDTAR